MRFSSPFALSFEGWNARRGASEMNEPPARGRRFPEPSFVRLYGSSASTDGGSKLDATYGIDRRTMRSLNGRDARWSVDAGDAPRSKVIILPKSRGSGSVDGSNDEPHDPVTACEDKLAKIKQRLRRAERVEPASTDRDSFEERPTSAVPTIDEATKTVHKTDIVDPSLEELQKETSTDESKQNSDDRQVHGSCSDNVEISVSFVNEHDRTAECAIVTDERSNSQSIETEKNMDANHVARSSDAESTSDTCTNDVPLETVHSSGFKQEDCVDDFEQCSRKRKKRRGKKKKPKRINDENCSSRANSKHNGNVLNSSCRSQSEKQKKKSTKLKSKYKNYSCVKNETDDVDNLLVQNDVNSMKCKKTSVKKVEKQSHNPNTDGPIYFCPETSKLFKSKKHHRKMKKFYNNSWVNNLCSKYLSFLHRPDSEKLESDIKTSDVESHQNIAFDELTGKFQTLTSSDCDSASEDAFTIVFKNDDTQRDTESDENKSRMRIASECESEDSFMICFDSDCEAPVCDNVFTNEDILNDNSWTSDEDEVDGSDLSEDEPTLVSPVLKGCLKKPKSRGTSPESEHSEKNVSFDENPVVHTIMEWEAEYQQSRIGPWEGFARDAERFKQRVMDLSLSLDWIFKREHRNRIYFQRFRPILIRQIREEKKEKQREAERLKKEQENKINNSNKDEETFANSQTSNNLNIQSANSESQSVNSELITVS